MNSKKLDLKFVLRSPVAYTTVLLLAVTPYFVADYQTCFLSVQANNPDASLLKFIRHVLIEKFSESIALTLILFGGIYLISRLPIANFQKDIKTAIFCYLKHSTWVMSVGFVLYAIVYITLQSLFPAHHPSISDDFMLHLVVLNFAHFSFLFYVLISVNIVKSLYHTPLQRLEVSDAKGKCFVDLDNIDWVVKENGIYELKSSDKLYRTDYSINYFEKILNTAQYIKINRAAIVKINLISGYNYWEHDKYLLRVGTQNEKEFVVSRQRMKSIKAVLN